MERTIEQHNTRQRAPLGALLIVAATTALSTGMALVPTTAVADEVISQRVQVSDLNLGSVDGQRTLVKRLNRAIEEVCTEASAVEISKLRQLETMQVCREKARHSVALQLAERGLELQLVASRQ